MNIIEAMELCVNDNNTVLIDNNGNEYTYWSGELLGINNYIYEMFALEDIVKLDFTVKLTKVLEWIKISNRTELMRAIINGRKIKVTTHWHSTSEYDMSTFDVDSFIDSYFGISFNNYKFEYLEEE